MTDTSKFIGKTFREVKNMFPNVRLVKAGPVAYVVTHDLRSDRLNVELGEENLKFGEKEVELLSGKKYTVTTVDSKTLDDGIVVEAHFG